MRIEILRTLTKDMIAVLSMVFALVTIATGQNTSGPASAMLSIDAGYLSDNVYVNEELGLELKLPSGVSISVADQLAGASKRIADSLKTGDAKNDRRLDLQETTSKVLLNVILARQSTSLSIAVGKATPESLRSLATSTKAMLINTGQYRSKTDVTYTQVSGETLVTFTVERVSQPVSSLRLYAFKRNGFTITIGLVYADDDGMNELENILNDIRFV